MPELPDWWDKDRQRQNKRSAKQEGNVATSKGGKRQPGSGSSPRAPQDAKVPEFLVQCKFTDKKSITIKADDWRQLRQDALDTGREPMMYLEMDDIHLEVTEDMSGRSTRPVRPSTMS